MYDYTREIKPVQSQMIRAAKAVRGEKEETAIVRKSSPEPCQSEIFRKFRDLFVSNPAISVPVGHLFYVERILALFSDLDLGLRLKSLRLTSAGNVRGEAENDKSIEIESLNELLLPTMYLCAKCGKPLPVKVKRGENGRITVKKVVRTDFVCDGCLEQYMPQIEFPDPEPDDLPDPKPAEEEEDMGYPPF